MSAIQATTTTPVQNAVPSAASAAKEIQDRFLTLLITQIKNQDPMNPLDNAQVTTQLAQITTVNGIAQLNTTMQGLASSLASSQAVQSASLIGRSVLAEGNALKLASGVATLGGVELPQAADGVKINILGPAGNVVRQIDLGARSAGLAGFQWDGLADGGARAAAGTYTFQVKAVRGTQNITATPVVAGTVSSISLGTDGLHLSVDGVGVIQMQQIKSIM